MRPKGKRQRVCQSINSAFSMLSSPLVHPLVSLPSTSHAAHLPKSPTSDHPSHSPSPARKRKRIYQSLSSAFSRYTTPRANSPELFPAGFPEAVDNEELVPETIVAGAQDRSQ